MDITELRPPVESGDWPAMTHLPPQIPRFTRELRQYWEDRGSPRMPPRPRDTHDALVDARHNLRRFEVMTELDARAAGWGTVQGRG